MLLKASEVGSVQDPASAPTPEPVSAPTFEPVPSSTSTSALAERNEVVALIATARSWVLEINAQLSELALPLEPAIGPLPQPSADRNEAIALIATANARALEIHADVLQAEVIATA